MKYKKHHDVRLILGEALNGKPKAQYVQQLQEAQYSATKTYKHLLDQDVL